MDLNYKKLRGNAKIPTYGTEFSAGADLYACIDEDLEILPGETKFIPTGISMAIPQGYGGFIYARSGLACKRNLAPANKVGVIDSDYRGEVMVALNNFGKSTQIITPNERIAQIVIAPYLKVNFVEGELDNTVRGSGGFGHTGKN